MSFERPKYFFKYVSAGLAKIILVNKSLRWSSPLLFDDPYDVTRQMAINISPSSMQKNVIGYLQRLVIENKEIPNGLNHQALTLLSLFKLAHKNNSLTEIVEDLYKTTCEQNLNSSSFDELKQIWENWLPELRILCLSASNDIPLMWDKYAANSTGVVLEFECSEYFSTPWLIAQPVRYENKPSLLDHEGWGKLLTLSQERATKYLFEESCYTKTTDWEYQQEWRVVSFKRDHETLKYADYGFSPQTLSAVYFGSEISHEDKREIELLLKYDLAHVKTYSGQKI